MIAAIFDLDGTLYTGHIWQGIAQHHRVHHVKRLSLYVFSITHMAIWSLSYLRLISEETAREVWSRDMGWLVRGWTAERAGEAFRWIAQEYVKPLIRSDVLKRLREHQAIGHRVILVSGTPSPLLAEIGRLVEVQDTVGTPLVLRNGRYTGASELPICQGAGKIARLEAYLSDHRDIHWLESYAYADSYTDLPLLERVGHPVAVYPDPKLAAHARQRGWMIIE